MLFIKVKNVKYSLFPPYIQNLCHHFSIVLIITNWYTIGYKFSGCNALTSVTIPNSMVGIGRRAFTFCTRIREVVCQVEDVFPIDTDTFLETVYSTAQLIVPKGTKEKYLVMSAWNKFVNIEESDFTGPSGIKPVVNGQKADAVYRADGKVAGKRFKGLNILHQSDGSVKKVMVK